MKNQEGEYWPNIIFNELPCPSTVVKAQKKPN